MKRNFLSLNATKLVTLMFVIMLNTFPLTAQAQQKMEKVEITENSTLQDLLAAAALNNPGLMAAFEQWQAALARVPQVKALPNPQLTFAYFIQEIETRVGPQQAKVGIMQMFPWFGKLKLKGNAAAEAANAEKQTYENLKLDLFYRVKEAYFDYYYITRMITILKENVQLLEHLESVIETKYRTGTALYANLVRIQVERDKLENQLKSSVDVLEPVKAKLNTALNRSLNAPLPTPKKIPMEPEPLELSRDGLIELLRKNNPGLKSMDFMAAKEEINIKLAKKNYYPDFSIGVDYMITDEARMPGVSDSGKDPLAAMVALQLPVWFKKNKAAVKEANARYRAVLNEKKEVENNLLARLEMVFFRYRDAKRKMALYKETLIPRAQQALEVTRSAFEAGKANFTDFIDSQRMLLAFELEYEEARTRRAQRLAELEMLGVSPITNEGGSFRENPTAWGNICRATTAEDLSSDVSPPWTFLQPHRRVSPIPPAKASDKTLIKSFLGVQGAIFQKSPLANRPPEAKGE